jgi:hypothetical protein
MAGPWERYQQPASPSAAPTGGPWERYATAPSKPDFSNVQSGASSVPVRPPEPPRGNPVTRFLGEIGGRQVLQGAAGLYGALGGDAINQYILDPLDRALFNDGPTMSGLITGQQPQQRSVLGTGGRSYRQVASDFADELGMRAPQTGTERVLSDVGEALTGTGLTLGIGGALNALRPAAASVTDRVGRFLTAQPGLQAVSTATGSGAAGVTREQGGSQGQQLAAGLVGGLSPGVAGAATGATVRGVVRGRDGAHMQRTIEDFAALGATPSVGQASGNRLVQGAENLLAGGPTSAGVMNRFAERQADSIGQGLQRRADSLSRNASAERAGRAIERGVDTFAGNTNATKRALYWQADQFIPEQTPVQLQNTWREVVDLTTPTAGATATTSALIQPTIIRLRENLAADLAAGGGSIPYSALKRIRSDIGEAISNSSPLNPTSDIRELRRLYAALSRDMEAAAQAQGPEAVRSARRANNYTRAVADRLEQVRRVVDKNGGPERVFNAVMSGTRDGGTTLRAVMQSLPKEGQQALTAAVIRRMGLATPGAQDAAGDAFSAATFLTNWNRVSPEAKRALFDRHGPAFSRDMDRIARVADNIKQGSRVFANPSGTANRAAAMTYGAALVGSMFTGGTAGIVASGVGANLLARWLTNPNVVRRLAQTTQAPVGALPPLISSIRAEAREKDDPDLLELAAELEKGVQNRTN